MGSRRTEPRFTTGRLGNGIEYASWGDGGRTLVLLPGGPGSDVPQGLTARAMGRSVGPYVAAGYRVLRLTRVRGMPPGHAVPDMAHDVAEALSELGVGRGDVVVGESFGGMIALHLAAHHPDRVGLLALVASGPSVSTWCADVDSRLAEALQRGDRTAAATIFGEYLVAGAHGRWLRRLLAPLLERVLLPDQDRAVTDALVEVEAERRCDASPLLPHLGSPTLVLAGDRDRIFPFQDLLAAARAIPDCEVRRFPGRGHAGMAASRRVPGEVLGFASRR